MKKYTLIVFFSIALAFNGYCKGKLVDKVKFASVEKANELLTQEDNFTRSWSQFDIDSRNRKKNSTREELFDLITKQTRAWTEKEKKKMISIFESIDQQIEEQGYTINFPEEIYFVKTTMQEEGGASGYTRASYVILKDDIVARGTEDLKKLIIHELFHVLTRNNPEFREEMYQIIGFHLMEDVAYPESLKDYRITNPDAPQVDSYIRLEVDGAAKECMMILYAKKEYEGGDFFKYLNIGFLSLTGDAKKSIEYVDGKPVIYSFKEVTGFFEQVGKNTEYIIHPEEILAENFTLVLLNVSKVSNPEIVNEIKKILKR